MDRVEELAKKKLKNRFKQRVFVYCVCLCVDSFSRIRLLLMLQQKKTQNLLGLFFVFKEVIKQTQYTKGAKKRRKMKPLVFRDG